MKKILKLTVKNGLVLFSGLIHYYWPINFSEKVDRIVGKTSFFLCIIYCVTNRVAVKYWKDNLFNKVICYKLGFEL